MNDKIVLICATGRSGSTTFQRIINTIPNSNICGENNGAINNLLEFYINLKKTTSEFVPSNNDSASYESLSYESIISKNIKPAWYNSYNLEEMKNCIRFTIINMFKNNSNTNLWGFKEIRYDGKLHLLNAFRELFPQTKVIIQIRENILTQSQSGWYKQNTDATEFLEKMNNELIDFFNQNKEWCYFTTFEGMFNNDNLRNIFKFIDCIEDYDESKIDDVLKNNLKD